MGKKRVDEPQLTVGPASRRTAKPRAQQTSRRAPVSGKKQRGKSTTEGQHLEARTVTLPIVGEVPMVRHPEYGHWTFSPNFTPPLPKGAIRGDITRQIYCCATPHYLYVDANRVCVQCGEPFVFSAKEQKYWYETLQFRLDSNAIRCAACRRQRRTRRAVALRYEQSAVHKNSDSAEELIEFATALAELVDRCGTGKPDQIVAAARKARRLNAEWVDPLYWEAKGHLLAGRRAKAVEVFQRFVDEASPATATRRLVADAKAHIVLFA
jgi:hypothetical protein